MNTVFYYQYRDASNYKRSGQVIFRGAVGTDVMSLSALSPLLYDREWFDPTKVGMPTCFFEDHDEYSDDHPWHEVLGLELTEAEPTDPRSIRQILDEFREIGAGGWESAQVMPIPEGAKIGE